MAKVDGDGSYRKLIVNIYGARIGGVTQEYKEYNIIVDLDTNILQFLLSFLHSGYYATSRYLEISNRGLIWLSSKSLFLDINKNYIGKTESVKGNGMSLRCVAK